MLTLGLISNIWHQLEIASSVKRESIVNNVSVISYKGKNPLLAIDSRNQRHLLIPVKSFEQESIDTTSAGINIVLEEWEDEGLRQKFVDIVCLKSHLTNLFDFIVINILQEIEKQPPYPSLTSKRVLNEWREFIDKAPSELPSESVLKGLYGELLVLKMLSKKTEHGLRYWVGPEGARHDFKSGNIAFEVKTISQHIDKLQITINGIDQLWAAANDKLYLVIIRVEKNPIPKVSFQDLLDILLSFGIEHTNLYKILSRFGLTPDLINEIPYGFDLLETKFYYVDEEFPKITPDSFINENLPDRVTNLRYQIDLLGEPPSPQPQEKISEIIESMIQG